MDEKTNGPVKPLYTDCNIPVKLFFDILNTKNFKLLGEGSEQELEEVFGKIFDEYTDLDHNNKINNWYTKNQKIRLIEAKIIQITNIINIMVGFELSEPQYLELVQELNAIPGLRIKFDVNKSLVLELERIQNKILGSLRNSLKMLQDNEEETTEKTLYIFQQDIAKMSTIIGFQISTDITMYEFITYKHTAQEHIKQQKNKRS